VQGNITMVAEPDPANSTSTNCAGAAETGTLFTCYTYDVMEHLTQVSMPRASATQTRTFNYSPTTHLLTSETQPETGTTTYTYTPDSFTNDLLTSKTDAKGQVTAYTYDTYYRPTEIQYYPHGISGGEDICQRVTYNYNAYTDPNSSFAAANAWGHVAAVATGASTCVAPGVGLPQQFIQMFGYTTSGHVSVKRLQLNGPGSSVTPFWDVGYTYNAFGQVVSTSYPSVPGYANGQTYTMGYDNMNRPATLKDSRGFYAVQAVVYNAADQPVQTQFQLSAGFNGATNANFWENRGYNVLNQLTVLNNFNTSNTVVNGPVELTYSFTAGQNNGQVTSATLNSGLVTNTFTYDALKRLTAAAATGNTVWSQNYTYDGFGNMTSKTGSGLTFTNVIDQTTNRLTGTNICYDADGNLISDQNGGGCGNPNYAYDVPNRMVSAKVSGGTEYYAYDADNKRISTVSATGVQTLFIYGAGGEKLSVVGGSGSISNNVYFAGRLIKQNTDQITGNMSSLSPDDNFVAVDRMGSVKKYYTAPAGTAYMPYGEEANPGAISNDQIKFATYTRDSSTGLDYADQRFYTSQFGRFMSADRFKQTPNANDSGSWNKYSYTQGDPINYYDPSGRFSSCPPGYVTDPSGMGCIPDPSSDPISCPSCVPGNQPIDPVQKGPGIVHVTNIAKSGANYDIAKGRFNDVLSQIDPDCLSYLNSGGGDLNSYVHDLLTFNLLAVGTTNPAIAAFTNSGGTDIPVSAEVAILVNNNSAFFNSNYTVDSGKYAGGTPQAQIFILLHELGHALGASGFQDDLGKPKAGQSNDNLINTNCSKTLQKFGSQ
jgi:RHS repeat-associated protein